MNVDCSNFLKNGFKLALPYNHSPGYLRELSDFLGATHEIYLPVPFNLAGSGRLWKKGLDPVAYQADVDRLMEDLRGTKIDLNFVVNVPVAFKYYDPLVEYLGRQILKCERIQLTVADFILAQYVRRKFPEARLCVSTIARVNSPVVAMYWIRAIGPESITVCRDINKRLEVLSEIKSLGIQLKVVAEEQCIPDCPAYLAHMMSLALPEMNRTARKSKARLQRIDQCSAFATDIRNRQTWRNAQKDIVPASLPNYRGIVDIIKLPLFHSTRQSKRSARRCWAWASTRSRRIGSCDYGFGGSSRGSATRSVQQAVDLTA